MDSAWLLRSPHEDGVHLAVRTLPGVRETLAQLVRWSPPGRNSGSSAGDVIDAALLPAGISSIAWNPRNDVASSQQLAACSAEEIHIIDLSLRSQPRRIRGSFARNTWGTEGAAICWTSAGRLVAYADGHCVSTLDAETGKSVLSFPTITRFDKSKATVAASLTAVGEHEILVGWRGEASGCIQLFDTRVKTDKAGQINSAQLVADDTLAVHSLCHSHLQHYLVASHSGDENTHSEIFIWDLRCRHRQAEALKCLRGGGDSSADTRPPLLLGDSARPSSLEWSPSKTGTLLAYAGGVYVCRLWELEASSSSSDSLALEGLETLQAPVPSTWLGMASALRFPVGASGGTGDLVAATWAHPSHPGTVLALQSDGALVASVQRGPQLCAWSPRGGGAVVRQWVEDSSAAEPAASTPAASPTTAPARFATEDRGFRGAPAVVLSDAILKASDACCLMRSRVEDHNYGVSRMSYDEYSRIVRRTGAPTASTEALASAWQWAKLADVSVGSTGSVDGDAEQEYAQEADIAFKGAQELLFQDESAEDEEVEQDFPEIGTYALDDRRRALQALGFPRTEAPFAPSPDAVSPPVDDVVRRVLRAVVWLQLERAASDFENLEAFCTPSARILVQQSILTFHAASACLQLRTKTAKASEEERGDETARAQALCTSIRGLQKELVSHWQDIPAAATIHLAFRFLDVVIRSSAFDDKAEVQSSFEEQVHALLDPVKGRQASFEIPFAENWLNVLDAKLQQMRIEQQRVVITDQAGVPVDLASANIQGSTLTPQQFPLHVEVARPNSCFRCAIALRFLSRSKLRTVLEDIRDYECFGRGLLDGLCILGLGGGEDASPLTAGALEELLQASLPPTASASESSGRRDLSGSGLQSTGTDGVSLVSAYVERTGDVQSAALFFCHTVHLSQPPIGLRRFLAQYLALLARWQLYRQRAGLHTLLTARLPTEEALRSRSPVLFCYFCNSQLTGPQVGPPAGSGDIDAVLRRCPKPACGKPTPSCAVCLLPIFVICSRRERSSGTPKQSTTLAVDSWVAWCQGCHHGGHIGHLEEWFSKHVECPVAGCDCQCGLY